MFQCIKLSPEKLALSTTTRLIKAEEYTALNGANALLAEAQKLADHYVEDARAQIASIQERAYAEGLKHGQEESMQRILKADRAVDAYLETVESRLSACVFTAVQKIVEQFDDHTLVESAVRQGLRQMRNQKQVRLRVAPDVSEALEEALRSVADDGMQVDLVPDAKLSADACVLESTIGVVKSSRDIVLTALQRVLNDSDDGRQVPDNR
ncbi:MAG TPA: HrpE/YscL family type III secretion apparatus protein [Gammaproteobacteria bacterium]|jgi:type III secretion protein L|nr:HrpE/YscL family type III secretion apparatus protein [Gammaproteobacteria bacterium]